MSEAGDDGYADYLDAAGQGAHHLRLLRRLGLLGLYGEAIGIGIRAHLRQARAALAGDDKAA